MAEITCPKCHTTFNISEEEYKSIKTQLRDQEFVAALHEREQAFEQSKKAEIKIAEAKIKEASQREIAEREKIIAELTERIKAAEGAKISAVNEIVAQKETEISKLQGEIGNKESEYKLKLQEEVAAKENEIAALKEQLKIKETEQELAVKNAVTEKETEIAGLKGQIKTKAAEQDLAVKNAVAEKEKEIASLLAQINTKVTEKELAVKSAVSSKEEELNQKSIEIAQLKGQIENQKKATELEQNNLKASYEQQLKFKEEEIERYKDFKAKQSTKMIGESLEVFCKNEFDKMRPVGFQNATFEKDNKVSETGSKGDFIFRESADGVEFISIMFEMKNEMDTTATKHKNEDFFKELDKDRKEKQCEYAVLVTLLEPDNDLYNNGIVDVSYKYEKMYVVRPQFFIPIITLLRNAAKNSLQYKKELVAIQNQNIDIANFEAQLLEFKQRFGNDCRMAGNSFQKAIEDIDKTIKKLESIKDNLQLTIKHMAQGNKKLEDITVKKLVRNNPTMAAKFAELQEEQAKEDDSNE